MRKEKETTLNGTKFKVTQLGFADGMELLTILGRILGQAVFGIKNAANFQQEMGNILGRVSFSELSMVVEKLAKSTRIEREPGRWPILEPEVDLAGKYPLTLEWLMFALEVNYGNFLSEVGFTAKATSPAAEMAAT